MKESIPHLDIELLPNGNIRLENESMGDSYAVDIHPLHLRLLAEKLGLVREMSASEAEQSRDISRYKRALLMIRDRAEQLHQNIFAMSQRGHEDLGIEVAQSAALADMSESICIEFEDDFSSERARSTEPCNPITPKPNNSAPGAGLAAQLELGVAA